MYTLTGTYPEGHFVISSIIHNPDIGLLSGKDLNTCLIILRQCT